VLEVKTIPAVFAKKASLIMDRLAFFPYHKHAQVGFDASAEFG
jgi:hypothetical protein